jgi:hypothetical protein
MLRLAAEDVAYPLKMTPRSLASRASSSRTFGTEKGIRIQMPNVELIRGVQAAGSFDWFGMVS